MNNTLRKPKFRSIWTRRRDEPRNSPPPHSIPNDPAHLAETLRSLAVRAHHAQKLAAHSLDESTRLELNNLRHAIRWLENELESQRIHGMLPYVTSLRRQVESLLY